MASGTIAAHVPSAVPTISRVTGMSATSRMMNGTERKPLMTPPRMRLTQRFSAIPPRFVRTSARPSGRPATSEITPEAAVMRMVSHSERSSSSNMIGVIAEHLHPRGAGRQKLLDLAGERRVPRWYGDEEPRHRLALDMIDPAMHEPVGMRQGSRELGENRALRRRTRKIDAEKRLAPRGR